MKDTRQNLLKTAAHIFAEQGYDGASVRQIAQAAKANVAAVNYHFGNKRGLYLAVIQAMTEEMARHVFGKTTLTAADLAALSRSQALELLHQILDRFLDVGLSRSQVQLEQMFAHAKLQPNSDLMKTLMDYIVRFNTLLFSLLARITGLPADAPELVFLGHTIYSQATLSDFNRRIVLHALKRKDFPPALRAQIKQMVWQNTLVILKLHEKRNTNA